jgi:cytochrome c biogenesis protein CcmG/thiol:disulfide interchange protein DsbE
MKSRWIIAGAAALSLALLTLPMLRQSRGGGEPLNAPGGAASGKGGSCDASGRGTFDFVLKDQNNLPVKLAEYKGKVVIVNFWATWCGPCKVEIPDFVKLYAEYKDKGLVIVGISIDDSPEQLQSFMREFKMNYPVVQMRPEVEDAWGPFYGYPTSFVVARDGSICTKHIGPATKEQFEQEIKPLLEIKPLP